MQISAAVSVYIDILKHNETFAQVFCSYQNLYLLSMSSINNFLRYCVVNQCFLTSDRFRKPIIFHAKHCMKSVCIRSFSGLHFHTFGLNTERYSVSLHSQSERREMRTRKTPNTDTIHTVKQIAA